MKIKISIDGACKGNPGPGGWGVAIFNSEDELIYEFSGGSLKTTNNRMELKAFIEACKLIEAHGWEDVELLVDSMYVLKGCTEWLRGWRQKDYKGVKNDDLWREIAGLRSIWLHCTWTWVKGHSGNLYNDKADDLANQGYQQAIEGGYDW